MAEVNVPLGSECLLRRWLSSVLAFVQAAGMNPEGHVPGAELNEDSGPLSQRQPLLP